MPIKEVDEVFNYKGYGVHDSHCRVRIYHIGLSEYIILLSEMDNNKGTSVTNDCEHIANEVLKTWGIDKELNITWFDSHRIDAGGSAPKEVMYSRIDMKRVNGKYVNDSTSWEFITKEKLEAIVYEPVEDEGC